MTNSTKPRAFFLFILSLCIFSTYILGSFKLVAVFPKTRTESISRLTPSFLKCMVDVGLNLPISKTGQFHAHHFTANNTEKWNEAIRFEPFKITLDFSSLVMDVGGNTEAYDSAKLFGLYPEISLNIYEPVGPFFEELKYNWKNVGQASLKQYGLGASARITSIPTSSLEGQSTFLVESESGSVEKKENIDIEIRDIKLELNHILTTREYVDVSHLNCEGCEWEILGRLVELNLLSKFRYIQV
jgi:hypothetical protein